MSLQTLNVYQCPILVRKQKTHSKEITGTLKHAYIMVSTIARKRLIIDTQRIKYLY